MLQNFMLALHTGLTTRFRASSYLPKLFFLFASLFFLASTVLAQVPTCGYTIKLESVTYANGQTTFIWSVTNPKPGNGSNGTFQDVSHFGVVLGTCVSRSDIVKGGSFGVDKSQSCYTGPYLKFDYGTKGSKTTFYTLVLKGTYSVEKTTAVIKSGSKTGCCTQQIDGVGCKISDCPSCEIVGNPVICNDGSTIGSTTLSVNCDGNGTNTYKWTNPMGTVISTSSSVQISGLSGPGVYSVEVTRNGCKRTYTKQVTIGFIPACEIVGNPVICNDGSTIGSTTLTVNCAGSGNTYKWTNPMGTVISTTSSVTISGVDGPGIYSVEITNNGCKKVLTKEVKIGFLPACEIVGNPVICNDGSTIGSTTLSVNCAGAGNFTYKWTNPMGTVISTSSSVQISGVDGPGLYSVEVTSNGCSKVYTKEVKISFKPGCFISGNTFICSNGASTQPTTLTAPAGFTYSWTGPNGKTFSTQSIQVSDPGIYEVTLMNADGCSSKCAVSVQLLSDPNCIVTSAAAKQGAVLTEESSAPAGRIVVTTTPNPFRDRVRFVIQSKESGFALLDVFNVSGVKLKTVFQGFVEAGQDRVVEYNVKGAVKTNLIYRLQIGKQVVTGKLISVQ
jgi:hypothetical protein